MDLNFAIKIAGRGKSVLKEGSYIYEFGPLRLDVDKRQLLRAGQVVHLTAKAFDILFLLIQRRGQVVTKDEIMNAIWPDTQVEDNNLTVSISVLRKALGENIGEQKYIETIPRRGYCFISGVQVLDQVKVRKSRLIAVLPFEDLGVDSSEVYLGIALADALIAKISSMKSGPVLLESKTASAQTAISPVQAGIDRDMDFLLSGQIQKLDRQVCVNVQLTGVYEHKLLWTSEFNEDFANIFEFLDSISGQIMQALAEAFSSQEHASQTRCPTESTEAFQAYIKGRHAWNRRNEEGLHLSTKYFEQALKKDPDFALAHAGLADYFILVSEYGLLPPREAMVKARASAQRALELDDKLAEAYATLAYVTSVFDWDPSRAEELFLRAIQLKPTYASAHQWYADLLSAQGRFEESIAEVKLARQLDPLSPIINAAVGYYLYSARRYDQAIAECRIALEREPNFGLAHLYLGLSLWKKDFLKDALYELQQAVELSNGNLEAVTALGHFYAASGDRREALKVLENLADQAEHRYISPYSFALIYAGLDEKRQALQWLEKAYEARTEWLHLINWAQELDSLRSEPGFIDLLRRVNHSEVLGAQQRITSLAVLPLVNENQDPELDYLSDGITETIINVLSQLPQLRVMARSTMFRYKGREEPREIGKSLHVNTVLTGKLLRIHNRLRISMELVKVADGSQIWGEQYNRKPSDIFAMQEEIAQKITEQLRIKLTKGDKERLAKRYTEDIEAYQLYLKGRYFWNKYTEEWMKKGMEYFEQAIAIDHNYALAYTGLADSYVRLSEIYMPPVEALSKAKAAAQRAVEIDDELAEAHISLGMVKMYDDHDWAGAEKEFKRAIELGSNNATAHQWYGMYLMYVGRFDEAIAEYKLAQKLDPLSLHVNMNLGISLYASRQSGEAIEQLQKTLDLEPNYYPTYFGLGATYVQQGDFSEGIASFQRICQIEPDFPMAIGFLGYAYAMSGQREEARRVMKRLKSISKRKYVSPYSFAIIYAALGENDQAFEWLEHAYEDNVDWMVWLKVSPELDNLRSDPRYTDLLRRVGFLR